MTHVTVTERFWSHVDKTDGCWLWTSSLNARGRNGYGLFYLPGKRIGVVAHRWAYEQQHGPVPPGMQLDHLCRVRRCVNPAHLEVVTPRENTLRGTSFAALNARKTHCAQGHDFTPENTAPGRKGCRLCRQCAAAKARRWRAERKTRIPAEQLAAERARKREYDQAFRARKKQEAQA